jgi:hypothetical protein
MEIKIVTPNSNVQVYQDGVLMAGTTGGPPPPPTSFPSAEYPAGPPPSADAVFNWDPFPQVQEKKEFTLGQYIQTVRLVIPVNQVFKAVGGWMKVFAWPGGEAFLNSRMIKNNIIQRAWYPAAADGSGLTINLQEDFCINTQVGSLQKWVGGDIIDFQFKTQTGQVQPVRMELLPPTWG